MPADLAPAGAEPLHDGCHRTADADRSAVAEPAPHRDRRTHPRRADAAQAGERDGSGMVTVDQREAPPGVSPRPTSAYIVSAMPSVSKPGPRLADEAGTRTVNGPGRDAASALTRQLRGIGGGSRLAHEGVEHRGRAAGVDGLRRLLGTGRQRVGVPGDDQRGGRVEHDDVAVRAALTGEHPADRGRRSRAAHRP